MHSETLSSLLVGAGAKTTACIMYKIHEFFPVLNDWRQIYCEPFLFTGAMFWNIPCKSAILNDLNNYVYCFWHVIAKHYDEFCKELEYVFLGSKWFDEFKSRTDEIGKAITFYMANRCSHGGIQSTEFVFKFENKQLRKDISAWKEKLDACINLSIWNEDYHVYYNKLLNQHGSADNRTQYYVYADPPYYDVKGLYTFEFNTQDHQDLAEYHNQLKSRTNTHIIISYNNVQAVKDLYPVKNGWFIIEVNWKAGLAAKKAENYNELLISNKPFQRYSRSYQATMSIQNY